MRKGWTLWALAAIAVACSEPVSNDPNSTRVIPEDSDLFLPAFPEVTRRCAAKPDFDTEIVLASPSDCTYSLTQIQAEYDVDADFAFQIPVVFHVIENNAGEGHISDAMIQSQIDVLNEDFRAITGTPGQDGNNAGIQFKLATTDPNGNPTNGIDRVVSNTYFSDSGNYQSQLAWDVDRYLNLYTNQASGALGYATFPFTSPKPIDDGVVLYWASVGRNSPAPPYNQGRTATHEIGHYLGLFHTFQDGCSNSYSSGDRLVDTNPAPDPSFGCPSSPSACAGQNAPNIHNYMDYTDDTCMELFTVEQVNRMRCSLINYRPNLYTVVGSNFPPDANFSATPNGLSYQFQDLSSDDGTIVSWQWQFGDGATATAQNPTHTYATSGNFTVTLTVTDDTGETGSISQNVVPNEPPIAVFEVEKHGLEIDFIDLSTDNGSIASWTWDFGDGSSSTEQNPTHEYAEEGEYTAVLTVTDDLSAAAAGSLTFKVREADDETPGLFGCVCAVSPNKPAAPTGLAGLLVLALGGLAVFRRRRQH